jgi:hypothetical protein
MATKDVWWIQCHFHDANGQSWHGLLLDQRATTELGSLVVITERNAASDEVTSQGNMLWVVPNESSEDRLVPFNRLDHVELVLVA